jgi:hypothetical protein
VSGPEKKDTVSLPLTLLPYQLLTPFKARLNRKHNLSTATFGAGRQASQCLPGATIDDARATELSMTSSNSQQVCATPCPRLPASTTVLFWEVKFHSLFRETRRIHSLGHGSQREAGRGQSTLSPSLTLSKQHTVRSPGDWP